MLVRSQFSVLSLSASSFLDRLQHAHCRLADRLETNSRGYGMKTFFAWACLASLIGLAVVVTSMEDGPVHTALSLVGLVLTCLFVLADD